MRELQNGIERAVALTRFEEIARRGSARAHPELPASQLLVEGQDPAELVPLEEVERRYVLRVLEAVGGSRIGCRPLLGIDRKTLYRKLELWGEGAAAPQK